MKLINYVLLALLIVGCSRGCDTSKHSRTHAVRKLKPTCDNVECKGGYAYQNNGGDWFFYYFIFSQSQLPYYNQNTAALSSVSGVKTWEQAKTAPQEEEFEQAEVDQNEIAEAQAPDAMTEAVQADVAAEAAVSIDSSEGEDSTDGSYSGDDGSGDGSGGDGGGGDGGGGGGD